MTSARENGGFFLTGALGCIGAWVSRLLVERDHRVTLFDLDDDLRRLRDVMPESHVERIKLVRGDITDGDAVRRALEEAGARYVVHLAGLQVPFCKTDPPRGGRVNVVGTLNLLEAAAEAGIRRVVYASSAAVFGLMDDGRAPDESAPCVPTTHYGVFKRANEDNARIYWNDRGLCTVGVRPLTVYGVGRDQGLTSGPTRAMKAVVASRPFHIGFSGATDYQFVRDTAEAFIACAEHAPEGAHVFNLHGESQDTARIVEMIVSEAAPGESAEITFGGAALPIPPDIDGTRILEVFPRLPRTPIEEGIRSTMACFRELLQDGRLDVRDLEP